jgi:hypothetical protein
MERIINQKKVSISMTSNITKEVLMEHVYIPLKEINLINSYINTLKDGMGPIQK